MLTLPADYSSTLSVRQTESAIKIIKNYFEKHLTDNMKLERVSAPLFVPGDVGLNDDLNGVERAVSFDVPDIAKDNVQIVHSLAKWKRYSLYKYGYGISEGIYTNMNAIRRDETLDNIHSIYVDQWDWERAISADMRTVDYLKEVVQSIVDGIVDTLDKIKSIYPSVDVNLSREVKFVTSQELEDTYPTLSAKEREHEITKKYKTVFIMQIGEPLRSGKPHDNRAPDYDDWSLNGDLLFWHDTLGIALELSSMGIRVDAKTLIDQLTKSNMLQRTSLKFHSLLLDGTLPLSIGGGIGQSRMCMLILGKAHIGEVHCSVWSDETVSLCEQHGIELL